jgi:hypothetical protein
MGFGIPENPDTDGVALVELPCRAIRCLYSLARVALPNEPVNT